MIDKKVIRKFNFDFSTAFDEISENNTNGTGISVEEINNCCGADFLAYFPDCSEKDLILDLKAEFDIKWDDHINEGEETLKIKKPPYPDFKSLIETEIRKIIRSYTGSTNRRIYLVILNQIQNWQGKLLKLEGFRLVSDRTVNGGSGQRLYVYIRDPLTPKGKSVKRTFR